MITRRYFVTSTAVTLFSVGFLPGFLRRSSAALAEGTPRTGRGRVLVVVFMRGAVDGLNVVVPHGDADYYAARPGIAVARPGASALRPAANEAASLDLDGHFGFHPRLAPLKTLFDARELAVVHAVGSPDNTRSHFDAQDYMESATPGVRSTPDGWLNRYLQLGHTAASTPFRGVAVAQRAPRSLQGAAPTLVLDDIASFHLGPRGGPSPQAEAYSAEVERMYASTRDALLAASAREMFQAIRELDRVEAGAAPPAGAEYPRGPLGKSLGEVATLIKAWVGLEIAFVEVGGWDHHVNEGSVDGQLARNLEPFASALAAFRKDLGARMEDVLLLTMSEFGRTVHENGNRGTDHGHGNVMLALGSGVRGGKVYGAWPGLRSSALFEGRDLAVTTDFRDVLSEALVRHLGCADPAPVFPGFRISREPSLGYLA
jgi:uncharacterized protein (DUF1501 family)